MGKSTQNLLLAVMLLIAGSSTLNAQKDSVVFNNGNYITGTVESMDRGVIVVSTDYSDDDFTIEWEKISHLSMNTYCIVSLDVGRDQVARIQSVGPGTMNLIAENGSVMVVSSEQVVGLDPTSSKFMKNISANIDVGYSQSKANNLQQLNISSAMAYDAPKWHTDVAYSIHRSTQDEVEPIARTESALNFRFNLPLRLFTLFTVSFLSNTEQLLDLRANTQAGLGAYIVRTNQTYWGGKLGVNRNMEQYTPPADEDNRNSWEGFVGTEINLFDIGDLALNASVDFYPGFTEKGRYRSDVKLDISYDFPLDFYVKGSFSLNWDNQPAEGSSTTDYVYSLGFGWEW